MDILTNGKHSKNIEVNICNWCGKEEKIFRNDISKQEYQISGFCQKCQDKTFGKD